VEVVAMAGTLIPIRFPNRREQVLTLWCTLTGHDPAGFDEPEREALLIRTEIAALAEVPDAVLLDAGEAVRRGTSLPLERWLAAVRVVRPTRPISA
jgi:hypothetical protein